jgi:hypothetical protein
VVLGRVGEGAVSWCGWHGMQEARGSNPLSSTTGHEPDWASRALESSVSRSRCAANCGALLNQSRVPEAPLALILARTPKPAVSEWSEEEKTGRRLNEEITKRLDVQRRRSGPRSQRRP